MFKLPIRFAYFRALAFVLGGLLLPPGCKSTVDEDIIVAELAQDCLVNSDCRSPLVCAFQTCHQECESSRDCDGGARCVGAARPYKVCQLEQERLCERSSDCVAGLVCADDGECRDQCQTVNDCVEDQVCVAGTCADPDELDEDGQLPVASGVTHGSEGSSCVYVSDCNGTLLCRGQVCLSECKADKDCSSGHVCQDGRCELDGTLPSTCVYQSDCIEPGKRCTNGRCYCSCAEDRDCPAREICRDHCACEPDPGAAQLCHYNSQCEIPGQICRDGTCDCECGINEDCAEGYRCDGCGCIDAHAPGDGGVVAGDVAIQSSLQLQIYRGVTVIQGDLTISGAIADFADTFDQLQAVDGAIDIQDNALLTHIAFPKLTAAGPVMFGAMNRLLSVDLGALTSANVVQIGSAPKLFELDLSHYGSGSIDISAGLTSLTLPALKTAPTLSLHEMPLESLSLSVLERVNNVKLDKLAALREVVAPSLKTLDPMVGPTKIIVTSTALDSLSGLFGQLTPKQKLDTLTISYNQALSNCEVADFVATFESVKKSETLNNGPCPL